MLNWLQNLKQQYNFKIKDNSNNVTHEYSRSWFENVKCECVGKKIPLQHQQQHKNFFISFILTLTFTYLFCSNLTFLLSKVNRTYFFSSTIDNKRQWKNAHVFFNFLRIYLNLRKIFIINLGFKVNYQLDSSTYNDTIFLYKLTYI